MHYREQAGNYMRAYRALALAAFTAADNHFDRYGSDAEALRAYGSGAMARATRAETVLLFNEKGKEMFTDKGGWPDYFRPVPLYWRGTPVETAYKAVNALHYYINHALRDRAGRVLDPYNDGSEAWDHRPL